MTIAEKLRLEGEQRGIQKGLQLGEQKGRQEGEREAALKIARTMYDSGLDRTLVMQMTGLTETELQKIRH